MALITEETGLNEIVALVFGALREASHDKEHPFRYFALANPQNEDIGLRTVVLRRVDEHNHCWIYTDFRTDKVQRRAGEQAFLLFYHGGYKCQIRLHTHIRTHYENARTKAAWQSIPDEAKYAYTSITAPGSRLSSPADAYRWHTQPDLHFFCMLEFIPYEMEILQLGRQKHKRAIFHRLKAGWTGKWIAP